MTLTKLIEQLEKLTEGKEGLQRENFRVFFEGNSVEDFEVKTVEIGHTTDFNTPGFPQIKIIRLTTKEDLTK